MSATVTGWLTSEPPQDGTRIVAVGRVISSDEFSTSVTPWVHPVRYIKTESGYVGWMIDGGSWPLAVARDLSDEVRIDFWLPHPYDIQEAK
jgi:hypothetical protein